MPIAYVIHPQTARIRRWLHKKAGLIYIFEPDGELGRIFADKGADVVSMTNTGILRFSNIESKPIMIHDARVANYLAWRKFMVLYHFSSYRSDRRQRGSSDLKYLLDPTRQFAQKNKNYKKAYAMMDKLDSDIRQSVTEIINREYEGERGGEDMADTLMNIAEHLYYGYAAHIGQDRYEASIHQSQYYYIVINLLLKFGVDRRDFGDDGKPSADLLTILCRVFNESVVHREKRSLIQRGENIQKAIELIKSGGYKPEDYAFGLGGNV